MRIRTELEQSVLLTVAQSNREFWRFLLVRTRAFVIVVHIHWLDTPQAAVVPAPPIRCHRSPSA